MELPPLSWNGVDEESKGEMKKGKEIRETINRYIELAGIAILKGDTGVFSIEKNKYWKILKKKKEKKKRNIHIRRINGASGNGLSNSISTIGSQRKGKFEGTKRNAAKTHLDHGMTRRKGKIERRRNR